MNRSKKLEILREFANIQAGGVELAVWTGHDYRKGDNVQVLKTLDGKYQEQEKIFDENQMYILNFLLEYHTHQQSRHGRLVGEYLSIKRELKAETEPDLT